MEQTQHHDQVGERTANFIKESMPSAIPLIKSCLDYLVQMYQAHK